MLARLRLFQLASQALPIGGYSHSHGLEAAIDCGLIHDELSVRRWIADALTYSVGSYELPSLAAMSAAWRAHDTTEVHRLNEEFLATREAAELRHATVQMGFSMRALLDALPDLSDRLKETLQAMQEPSLPCVWSGAASAWAIEPCESVAAYAWSWAENQVLVAMKSVPIGQSAGQRILLVIGAQIAAYAGCEIFQSAAERSNFAPGLAVLSAQHETQYSRLFRS